MTKMSYEGMPPYGGGKNPPANASGLIATAMSGGATQENNPVMPMPRILDSDTAPIKSGYGAGQEHPLQGIYGGGSTPGTDYTWVQDQQGTYQRSDGVDPNTGQWRFPELNQGRNAQDYLRSIDQSRSNSSGGFSMVGGGAQPAQSSGNVYAANGGAAQKWQIDPSQTVEGRAAGIISKDGALMQQARGQAMQRANERGLINSSLAIQAAQDAVLGRATDIAKSDAATFADAGKFNVNQSNSWNLAQQELAQKGTQFDKDLQYRYDSARMNNDNAIAMAALENKYQSQLQSDAAFNSQYRAYVDALLIIDQNQNLDAAAKQALKFEQARILENYASIRGLNLNLDFSSMYKGAPGAAGQPGAQAGSGAQAGAGGIGSADGAGGGEGPGGAPSGSAGGVGGAQSGPTNGTGNPTGADPPGAQGFGVGGFGNSTANSIAGTLGGMALNALGLGPAGSLVGRGITAALNAPPAAVPMGSWGGSPGMSQADAEALGADPGGFGNNTGFGIGDADPSGADPGGFGGGFGGFGGDGAPGGAGDPGSGIGGDGVSGSGD